MAACVCHAVGRGVQLFRIRDPGQCFAMVVDLGPDYEESLGARQVWTCRTCGAPFAVMRIPFKSEEDVLVRAPISHWQNWDWSSLAGIAANCGWRGPSLDRRYVM